jgi:hypothetical protein
MREKRMKIQACTHLPRHSDGKGIVDLHKVLLGVELGLVVLLRPEKRQRHGLPAHHSKENGRTIQRTKDDVLDTPHGNILPRPAGVAEVLCAPDKLEEELWGMG